MINATYYRVDGLLQNGWVDNFPVTAFYKDGTGNWRMTDNDVFHAQDITCVPLHESIRMAVMSRQEYEDCKTIIESPFIYEAGIDPESLFTKQAFENMLSNSSLDNEALNRCLYWQDFSFLVSNIQSGINEVVSAAGEFIKIMCQYEFENIPDGMKFGVRRSESAETRMATLLMHMVFVRMYSVFDYAVKLALEVERDYVSFDRYPKLIGLNSQFKNKHKISFNGKVGTLFEDCEFIRKISAIRNRIIHDGHLSPNQWLYERYQGGKVVEKFILFPDMELNPGSFDRCVNRSSFYGGETKVNLELPNLIAEFLNRTIFTLSELNDALTEKRSW